MSLKLFIADDSVTIQKIVNLAFSGEDVVIEAVSDGSSALESLRGFKPDVVLADVFMPGCSGYEVCERIKADPELNHIPVILLVGTFEPFDESEASRVHADRWLTKPFDTSELIQTVNELAKGKEMLQKPETTAIAAKAQDASHTSSSRPRFSPARGMVSTATWESFLGEGRVLELFDAGAVASVEIGSVVKLPVKAAVQPNADALLSEDSLNMIVDRVVRRMSSDVIRDVAWEVVPEISEAIIRRTIQERK
jgi:CheY-like chemotaxis protein